MGWGRGNHGAPPPRGMGLARRWHAGTQMLAAILQGELLSRLALTCGGCYGKLCSVAYYASDCCKCIVIIRLSGTLHESYAAFAALARTSALGTSLAVNKLVNARTQDNLTQEYTMHNNMFECPNCAYAIPAKEANPHTLYLNNEFIQVCGLCYETDYDPADPSFSESFISEGE